MKKAQKILSIVIAALMLISIIPMASFADDETKLCFNADGSFKILMVNDTQDDQKLNKNTKKFLEKAIAQENPDLIVVAGDILSDIWPGASEEKLDKNINELCTIFQNAGVPFAITFGNHDHDRIDECSSEEHIMEVATKYSLHVDTSDGCTPATYSIPIYSNDGSKVSYVVYMFDSNNKGAALSMSGYTGLTQDQIDWFKSTQDAYKAVNGGSYIPSTVIQHVPVAEIYDFLKEVPMADYLDKGVVFSSNDYKWYKLNTEDYPDMTGVLGEAPCSELVSTGEYQAMVDTGVASAFFAHDHVNSFAATTKDGIYMGYNGGTGFNSYNFGDGRSCRVINVTESNATKSDTHLIYYRDVVGEKFDFYYSDLLSPTIITTLMQIVMAVPAVVAKIVDAIMGDIKK